MIRESQEAHTNFVPPPQEVPSSLLPLLGHRSQLRMDITSLEDRRDDVQRIANQTTGREHAAAVSRLAELESQLDAARLALSVVDRELAGHTGAPVVYTEAPSPPPFVSISSPAFPDEVLYAAGGAGAILMLGMLAMMVYMRSVARTTRNALSVIESQVSSQHATLASGIEAIAVEVERLGEGQRFMSKLIANESQGVPAPRPNH
jgi:hypothetical protein